MYGASLENTSGVLILDRLYDIYQYQEYSYVFYTDATAHCLYVSWQGSLDFDLYEVISFDTVYDASRTGFHQDMEHLFHNEIDLSKYSTKRVDKGNRTAPFIDLIAVYSDIQFDWTNQTRQSGYDYLYFYNCYGEIPVGGTVTCGGYEEPLTVISGNTFFTKFQTALPRMFANGEPKTRTPIDNVTLNFIDGSSRVYLFSNFYVTIEYANQTDGEMIGASFSGNQKLMLDVSYTYWREGDFSDKGANWHNQVDSIYFGIPNYLLEHQELVNVTLEYQQVTTKPIVVTKTDEKINQTSVSEWFQQTASNPHNELTANWGWTRYQKGVPYFMANRIQSSRDYLADYSFNVRNGSGEGPTSFFSYHPLYSIYWAFDVEDPTIVSKSSSLTSGELADSRSSVSSERIEEWMLNYPLTDAETTYTAANPKHKFDPEQPETVEVNGILFSDVKERGTFDSDDLTGTELSTFGNTHNFFQNLAVGPNYAFSHLIGAVENDGIISKTVWKINNFSLIDNIADADTLLFAASDLEELQAKFFQCQANGETLHLVHFNLSQYYSASFDEAKYKEGHVDSGTEKNFDGYLAVMDVYLDLQVISLTFQTDSGAIVVYPAESNHINGIADVTHAPEEEQLKDAAGEAMKEWINNQISGGRDRFSEMIDLLKKIGMAILITAGIVAVIWVVSKVAGIFGKKNTIVIRDDVPPRDKRRRG